MPLIISLPIPGPPQCFLVLTHVIALLYFQCLFCFSMCWYFFPVCLQFRLKLMSEQDCAGDSSSKRHWTSFKTWGENHLQQALLPFTSSLLPLPSDPSQDPKTPPGQEEGDHSWLLVPRPPGVSLATPSPPQCSWAAPAGVLPRRCWGIFLAWILCSLLLTNPLWATSRTLKCGKLARAKYFLFPCSDLWTGWTAEVMPGEGWMTSLITGSC